METQIKKNQFHIIAEMIEEIKKIGFLPQELTFRYKNETGEPLILHLKDLDYQESPSK